jgi:Fic family protein
MNCHYSNLIEGHNTHPIDIERALRNTYSDDKRQRDLQVEAKAHISVQEWIDDGGLNGGFALRAEGICEIHRRFCNLLPEDLLWVEDSETKERIRVVPGELRDRDVKVGLHVPVSPGALPRFLHRFEKVYRNIGKTESILSTAAAHHRLLWMHPFLDGNGPRGAADVACRAARQSGYWRGLVGGARPGAQGPGVQGAACQLRPDTA